MAKTYDVKISFGFPVAKFLFTELFLKKLESPLSTKIIIVDSKKGNAYKDLVYSSRWIEINFSRHYFDNKFLKRNHIEFSDFIFKFFDYLFTNLKEIDKNRVLLKISFNSERRIKFCFLYHEIPNLPFLKNTFSKVIKKIEEYRMADVKTMREIKRAFKLKSREVYYEFQNSDWVLINLLFNAGKYHHENIAKNLYDNRIAKPNILVNEEYLNDTINYKAIWQLKARKREFVRTKPNDIALYSNISLANLRKAKEIYDDKNSVLWKFIQMPEDEQKLMDYYELIITAIILAHSSVEALINISIPENFFIKEGRKIKVLAD